MTTSKPTALITGASSGIGEALASYVLGRVAKASLPPTVGGRLDIQRGLQWLGPRMLGADLPPPR